MRPRIHPVTVVGCGSGTTCGATPEIEPWDIALAGLMLATSIIVLTTRIDVERVGDPTTRRPGRLDCHHRHLPRARGAPPVAPAEYRRVSSPSSSCSVRPPTATPSDSWRSSSGSTARPPTCPCDSRCGRWRWCWSLVVVSIVVFDNEPTVGVIAAGVAFASRAHDPVAPGASGGSGVRGAASVPPPRSRSPNSTRQPIGSGWRRNCTTSSPTR